MQSLAGSKASIDEERNLHLDRPGKGKTQEQIKRHTMDVGLEGKPIDRALHILTIGDDMQKISIINSLPQIIAADSNATFNRIIPKLKQDLPNSSCEFQIAASAVFKVVLQRSANTAVLQSILQGVEARDPNVAYAWSEALFGSIPNLPEVLIQSNLLPLVKKKFQPNSPVVAKVFCCRLVGEICGFQKFRQIDVKKEILPTVTGLCQDVNPDVRAQMCMFMPKVALALGNDAEKTNLLSCIVELAADDNVNVRSSSIIAIAPMFKVLSAETSKTTVLPMLKKLCTKACDDSLVAALVLSGEYNNIISSCQHLLNEQDVQFFVRTYKQLSVKGKQATTTKANASKEVTVRQRCASNIGAIMRVVYQNQPSQLQELYASFRDHAVDPCYLVRRAAAEVIADIAEILGKDNKIMKNEVVRLIRDDAVEVLEILVPQISSIFTNLTRSNTLNYNEATQPTTELCKALIKCQNELGKGYNWRLTIEFLKQLEILPLCVPADFIHSTFTPSIFDKMMNGKSKPVRRQAASTLIVFMRYNFKPNQNKWLRESLIKQTAQSKCFHNRMLYFYLCEAILSIYSEKQFKEFFLPFLLPLASDKIANIRWKFMQFSTRLKSMVSLAGDAPTKQKIHETIAKLESSEKTKCVLDIIKIKKREVPAKLSADALREEERRVKEEATTDIKAMPIAGGVNLAATGDAKHVLISKPDMPFLEQHFYIDAGVKLEAVMLDSDAGRRTPTPPHRESYSFDGLQELLGDFKTSNITDDVKVNLSRRLRRDVDSPVPPRRHSTDDDRTKRHSSVLSAETFARSSPKTNTKHRRSLNLSNLSLSDSRIPVSNRSKSSINRPNTKDCSVESNFQVANDKRKVSGLPVYIRRGTPAPAAGGGRPNVQGASKTALASSAVSARGSVANMSTTRPSTATMSSAAGSQKGAAAAQKPPASAPAAGARTPSPSAAPKRPTAPPR